MCPGLVLLWTYSSELDGQWPLIHLLHSLERISKTEFLSYSLVIASAEKDMVYSKQAT